MGDAVMQEIVKDPFIHRIFYNTDFIYKLLRMILIIVATLLINYLFRKAFAAITKGTKKVHLRFLQNIISTFIYLVGFMSAFGQFKAFSEAFNTILAGSGIAALAIGLAAQESLGNAINGIFVSLFKPFEIGDRIYLNNSKITGIVEDITLRHTIIKTYANSRILVPNTVINKELIENSNFQNNKASSFIDVTIPYDTDHTRAREIISDIISNHPLFIDNRDDDEMDTPIVTVFARELGLPGITLRASMWSKDTSDNFLACSEARLKIVDAFAKESIRISTNIAPLPKEEPLIDPANTTPKEDKPKKSAKKEK